MSHIVVRMDQATSKWQVLLGGIDIAGSLRPDVTIKWGDNLVPTLEAGLVAVTEFEGPAMVQLRDVDREALIALGWTPPA